jgi:hypothetical protein
VSPGDRVGVHAHRTYPRVAASTIDEAGLAGPA